MTVLPPRPALDEIDQDLQAAWIARREAFHALRIKDNDDHRKAYAKACAELDALLDMHNAMATAERIVTA